MHFAINITEPKPAYNGHVSRGSVGSDALLLFEGNLNERKQEKGLEG